MSVFTVPQGGTGVDNITNNKVLVGNGTGNLLFTKDAPTGAFVGDTATQTLTNKTISAPTFTGVNITSLITPFSLTSGGTGFSNITSGKVLVGNGTSLVANKTAPSGAFVGDTDTQTISNKTLTTCTISALTSPLAVTNGGTAAATLASNKVLMGNGTSALIDTLDPPSGDFVGVDDVQSLTNKTITASTVSALATPLSIANGGTGLTSLSANSFVSINGSGAFATSISKPLPITNGGLGMTTASPGTFVSTSSGGLVTTSFVVPSGAVVGLTDTQTLTNKTITTSSFSGLSSPLAIADGGTAATTLTSGRVLVTNSGGTGLDLTKVAPSGAFVGDTDSQSISGKEINGTITSLSSPLGVASGGTGVTSLTSNSFLVGNGTNPITFSTVPTGAVVGNSDTQTFTNKTITDSTNSVAVDALKSSSTTIDVTAAGPTASQQELVTTSTSATAWSRGKVTKVGSWAQMSIINSPTFFLDIGVTALPFLAGDQFVTEVRGSWTIDSASDLVFRYNYGAFPTATTQWTSALALPSSGTYDFVVRLAIYAVGGDSWRSNANIFVDGTPNPARAMSDVTADFTAAYGSDMLIQLYVNCPGTVVLYPGNMYLMRL